MSILDKEWKLSQQAQEFFVYAVLGIAKNDAKAKDKIIKKCIRAAYLDMNRTLLLKDGKSDDKTDSSFYKKYSQELFNAISENLPNIKEAQTAAFNLFFVERINEKEDKMVEELGEYLIEKDIKDKYKRKGKCFYFGQAQKWINMTFKYLWLLGLVPDDNELDIPIDSYIMEAASEELKIELPRDNKSVTYGEYASTTMPWSKLSKHEYDELQNSIKTQLKKDDKIPMQWENEAWIRISEKRKGIDITQK